MTREEAKELLVHIMMTYEAKDQYGDYDIQEPYDEALTMAIEALTRPQGEWIAHATSVGYKKYIEYSRCSECGEMALVRMNFCPNCGAKMDGERREP